MASETEKRKIEETVVEILRSCNMHEVSEFLVRKTASDKLGINLSEPTRKKFVHQVVETYFAEQDFTTEEMKQHPDEIEVKEEEEEEEEEEKQKEKQKEKVKEKEKEEEEEEEEEEDDDDDDKNRKRKSDGREYDDEGDLIACRLSKSRRVTLTEFRGKKLVSMREYYRKEGKELPTNKGISLTAEQWASFSKNLPAIEKAIRKMESRLN